MLLVSFLSVFASLIPIVLGMFLIEDAQLWRVCLVVLGVLTLGLAVFLVVGYATLTTNDQAVVRPFLVYLILAILVVVACIELLAAFITVSAAPAVFFAGLLVLLADSVYLVLRFLFVRPAR